MSQKKTRTRKKKDGAVLIPETAPLMTVEQAAPPVMVQPPGSEWRVVGASVQGVSHSRLDMPCQDAQGWRRLPNGDILIAVADGAGSAPFSDEGARLAVSEALDILERELHETPAPDPEGWTGLFLAAFDGARLAIGQLADAEGRSPREYAATLALAVAKENQVAAGQVGDGAIVADFGSGPDQELALVTRLQRGEYANETHFVTQDDALEQAVIEVIDRPARALAVMSDGLIRLALKLPAQEPHLPFFQPLFRFVSTLADEQAASGPLADFLASERVNARTDDDKTLVLAVRIWNQETVDPGTAKNGVRQ